MRLDGGSENEPHRSISYDASDSRLRCPERLETATGDSLVTTNEFCVYAVLLGLHVDARQYFLPTFPQL
jgi:hypothetical protein